ncbi:MAG: histidine kinase [Nitrospirae bacterium]|nr:histidine kinase [Nitrospirota bacterium]NTW65958.1 histidine kinase [Nitrospirota bacterium]
MTELLIKTRYQQLTLRRFILSAVLNALINTAIAVLLTVIKFGQGFQNNLIISQCIGFSIYGANLAIIPLFRRTKRAASQVTLIVLAVLFGAMVGTVLGSTAVGMGPAGFFGERLPFFTQIVLLGILFGLLVSYVFVSLERISEERLQRIEMEKAALEAELRLVQSQMEPHFLFNTLANVRSLIDADPPRAGAMLETFVAFLRTSLRASRERTVPLSLELEIVKNYLDLFRMRMGDRLRYQIDLPDMLRGVPIPPLLIQPLIENAVKHGLEPAIEGGEVAITVDQEDNKVRIRVTDSGVGIRETSGGSGIGLENVRKRLTIIFGERASLVLEERAPHGVTATIMLPAGPH